jgi:hypothetical protein
LRGLFGGRVSWDTVERELLDLRAFERPPDYAEHFKAFYGPAIAARANAEANGRAEEFDAAVNAFAEDWNLGTPERARFEKEYLLAVGTRAES